MRVSMQQQLGRFFSESEVLKALIKHVQKSKKPGFYEFTGW